MSQVWVCEEGHSCANGSSAFFCFAYDEVRPPHTHGGVRPFHRMSDHLTQLTFGPDVMQIVSRNPSRFMGDRNPRIRFQISR